MELLERDDSLSRLRELLTEASNGESHAVLVGGEAGVGKSALVKAFVEEARSRARVLEGQCEPLSTPHPLAPVRDWARIVGGSLRSALADGVEPMRVFQSLADELEGVPPPVVVVVEDVHWADEASLDVLKLTVRRMDNLRGVLLIVTLRDDEPGTSSSLRFALGELARAGAVRLQIEPLSPNATARLAEQAGRSAEGLWEATRGNPFFVTEVLAGEGESLPASIRDAVLGRLAKAPEATRRSVEAVSVVPGRPSRQLIDRVTRAGDDAVDDAIDRGLLVLDGQHLGFRHDLARMAVESSMATAQRRALHAAHLECLAKEAGAAPAALMAHHALGADDVAAIRQYCVAAAMEAAAVGSHIEAAAHYAAVLDHAPPADDQDRAELLERLSYEYYLTAQLELALATREKALLLWKRGGNADRQAAALRRMSRLAWLLGRGTDALGLAERAVAALDERQRTTELAFAYSNLAMALRQATNLERAAELEDLALRCAKETGDPAALTEARMHHALNNLSRGDENAVDDLLEVLREARAHHFEERIAQTLTNIALTYTVARDHANASAYLSQSLDYCKPRDLHTWASFTHAWRAIHRLEAGDWEGAEDDALLVLEAPNDTVPSRVVALAALARLRARRKQPAAELIEEALTLAAPTNDLMCLGIVTIVRFEAAWLSGTIEEELDRLRATHAMALAYGHPWAIGEIGVWLARAGEDVGATGAAEPYALELAGEPARAARAWEALGCPYDAALARAGSSDREELVLSLDALAELGASAAEDIVRHRMRALGFRGVRRGPQPSTRANPAGLTRRQMEVLGLLAGGLSNDAIARRLFVSPKTVDHHVSAVLAKLEVGSRGEAVATAQKLGMLEPAG